MKKYFSVKRLKFDKFCTTLLRIFLSMFMKPRSASSDFSIVAGGRVASAVGGRGGGGEMDGWWEGGSKRRTDGGKEHMESFG